jgi:hypothetical protein
MVVGDAENHSALALHQFRIFHHVTIPVLGSSFGGTPAPMAGTGLSAKVNSHTAAYRRNSHYRLGFSSLYRSLKLGEAPHGMVWKKTQ